MPGRTASGPIRGNAILEPLWFKPPCGMPSEDRYPKKKAARSARDLREQGCTPQDLREQWGFNASQMAQAGLSAIEIRDAGVSTAEIANCRRFSAAECREAGCECRDMMGGRFSMAVLLQAGFGPGDFKRAGLTAAAIRSLGFSEAAILEGGGLPYTASI